MDSKWLVALGVFCTCVVIITVIGILIWLFNEEETSTDSSTSKSTSTSTSTKVCYDTKLKIDPDKDCEEEYEKLVCPNQTCRPEETKKMCYCLISSNELSTLPFVGKTYVLGIRKVTIKSNGEVITQDNSWNECFKAYVSKTTTVSGKTRYILGESSYYEDGIVMIFDGAGDGTYKVGTELSGFTPRTDCINSLRW